MPTLACYSGLEAMDACAAVRSDGGRVEPVIADVVEVGTAEPVRGIRVRRAHVARIRVWRSTPGMGAREQAEEPGEDDGGEAESSHGLSPIAETGRQGGATRPRPPRAGRSGPSARSRSLVAAGDRCYRGGVMTRNREADAITAALWAH